MRKEFDKMIDTTLNDDITNINATILSNLKKRVRSFYIKEHVFKTPLEDLMELLIAAGYEATISHNEPCSVDAVGGTVLYIKY